MRGDGTFGTTRLSGRADPAAVKDQQMAEERPTLFRNDIAQIELQLYRIVRMFR